MGGWRIMRRVSRRLRRPGARHSFDCDDYTYYEDLDPLRPIFVEDSRFDRYLASMFPGTDFWWRVCFQREFQMLTEFQDGMLFAASCIAVDGTYFHTRPKPEWWPSHGWPSERPSELCMDIREAHRYVFVDWKKYLQWRMKSIKRWSSCRRRQAPMPEQQRQFEKEAWYFDKYHKRVLAARRRVARFVILRLLRRAVKHRALALYWQEQTQRALCAPGGAGRAADRDAFESEFA